MKNKIFFLIILIILLTIPIYAQQVCSNCNGRGLVICDGEMFFRCSNGRVDPCPQCFGTGKLTSQTTGEVRNERCLVCGGRGWLICKKCGGKGQIICRTCNGMGQLNR